MQAQIDWQRLLRPVCTYAMHLLRVPLQGAPSAGATVITPPDLPSASIIDRVCSSERSCAEHLGKLLVQAVAAGAPQEAASPEGLTPLAALQRFTALLEHYYHAPNAGKCGSTRTLSPHPIRRPGAPMPCRHSWRIPRRLSSAACRGTARCPTCRSGRTSDACAPPVKALL